MHNVLIVKLLIILFIERVVPSTIPNLNTSNITNASSMVESKRALALTYSTVPYPATRVASTCYCPTSYCESSSSSVSSCFATDTLVTLTDHQRIPIHQLRPGDQLLTTDGTTIFTTHMMMMLDKNAFSQAMFHTIVTASGHSVSLTKLHLIPIIQNATTISYVPAKEVKVGDVLYVMSDHGQMVLSPVAKVTVEVKTGYYAPLTTSGTVLVNGIMASCFSNVKSHEAAQWHLGPLRGYYWMAQSLSINEPFGSQNTEGMHFIPYIMYQFGRFFRPTTLLFT